MIGDLPFDCSICFSPTGEIISAATAYRAVSAWGQILLLANVYSLGFVDFQSTKFFVIKNSVLIRLAVVGNFFGAG